MVFGYQYFKKLPLKVSFSQNLRLTCNRTRINQRFHFDSDKDEGADAPVIIADNRLAQVVFERTVPIGLVGAHRPSPATLQICPNCH